MHTPVHLPAEHPIKHSGKVAIVLVNLGSPDAPTAEALKPYLKEFLGDPRVVEIPRPVWWLILNGIILNTRPKKSAHAYETIWDTERNLSPLIAHTADQTEALQQRFGTDDGAIKVVYAMRYGNPHIRTTVAELHDQGYDRQLIVPLYPQYAASTTATIVDAIGDQLKSMRHQPTLRYLPPYYDHPAHISALAESVREHMSTLDWQPEKLVMSFHGIPKRYFEAGDPYHCHCAKTNRLVNEALADTEYGHWQMTFQSLFGKAEWLKPYTEPTLIEMAKSGVKSVAVICPGFASDCLETLEEIAIAAKEAFLENGGERFTLVPCLNATPASIDMLDSLITEEAAGWIGDHLSAESTTEASA